MTDISENVNTIAELLKEGKSIRYISEELKISRTKLTNFLSNPPESFPLISKNIPSSSSPTLLFSLFYIL
jgi:hypothetical protein